MDIIESLKKFKLSEIDEFLHENKTWKKVFW
jgi:hypothetical protein